MSGNNQTTQAMGPIMMGPIALLFFTIAALSGCATVHVPNIGQEGYTLEDDERRMAKRAEEACDIIDRSGHLYDHKELQDYVNQLADQLGPSSVKEQGLKIQVRLLKDPSLNAFALPNGRIYIHTGIISAMENEAQLAALLAHEMTHVINRHQLKQFRSIINKSAFWMTMQVPTAMMGGNLAVLLGELTMVSSVYGFSQELEYEADTEGFQMLIAQGYDIQEAPKLFEHLKVFIQEEEIKQPFFFSTHPKVQARVHNFKALINESSPQAREGKKKNSEAFQAITRGLVVDNFLLALQAGMFKTAERSITAYLHKYPEDAFGFFYQGELYRQRQDHPKKDKKRDKASDYPQALVAYDQAITRDKNFAAAYRGKGQVLQKLNKITEAKDAFREYLRLEPDAPDREFIDSFLAS